MTSIPFSFELFPPRNAAVAARMPEIAQRLGALAPEFISVTFGASGSTQDRSLEVLKCIREVAHCRPMAHLTCVGATTAGMAATVAEFIDAGIVDFLALRGDKPRDAVDDSWLGELRTAAELTQLIRGVRRTHIPGELTPVAPGENRWRIRDHRDGIIAVAAYPNGHPESRYPGQDVDALLAKQAAGANLAITQLFFNADDYLRFVDEATAAGVTMPILPGIMPITSVPRLNRMGQLTGEQVPQRLYDALQSCSSDAARRELGIAQATALCLDLLATGAPGLHIYTHNRIDEPVELLGRVGAITRTQAEAALMDVEQTPTSASAMSAYRMLLRSH